MRGRGRRGPNPLARSYESNGPDVKVRGTAAHIAEKYMQLARDAHASGDPVLAESYLQHAEHYFRVIAAAQPQSQQPGTGEVQQQHRYNGGGRFDSSEDDGDDADMQDTQRPSEPQAKPAGGQATEAEAEQPAEEQPAPAPRRRRRRTTAEQASGNGAESSSKPNGHDAGSQQEADSASKKTSKEDASA